MLLVNGDAAFLNQRCLLFTLKLDLESALKDCIEAVRSAKQSKILVTQKSLCHVENKSDVMNFGKCFMVLKEK